MSDGRVTGVARILICDDEPPLRELMRIALTGHYSFEEAATVGEAIEAADRFRPDVALVDLMMPGGSGLDVIRHLASRPELRHTRSVVVSAFSEESQRREAEAAGAVAFVAKPFDPDELSATVDQLLDRRAQS
jgi:CheY-like chemotaxis protein